METGHHRVKNICNHIKDSKKKVKIGFIHHGRAMLANLEKELTAAKRILGGRVFMARDGMKIRIT